MGRQAYLTRLALGRSSYGELLRDENGDVVVGPHTHDDAAKDYVQQFDEKARPVNRDTETTNRRLRRAQNEVLKVAGVVRKKGDIKEAQTSEEAANGLELELLDDENAVGTSYWLAGLLTDSCAQWWLYGIRHRLFTFRSSLEPPIWPMVLSEARAFGVSAFFFSGLPWNAAAACVRALRQRVIGISPTSRQLLLEPRSRYSSDLQSVPAIIGVHVLDICCYAFEWPFRALATLQVLQLIPAKTIPSLRAFLPWDVYSPTQLYQIGHLIAARDSAAFGVALISNPFLLAYLSEIIRESLVSGIRGVILNCSVRPEEPDLMSAAGLERHYDKEEYEPDEALVLGRELGIPLQHSRSPISGWGMTMRRRYRGPRTILSSLSLAFPGLFGVLQQIPFIQQQFVLPVSIRRLNELRAACNRRYNFLAGLHGDLPEVEDHMIREEAVLQGFRFCGADAIEAGIPMEQWVEGLVREHDDDNAPEITTPALSPTAVAAFNPPSPTSSVDRSEGVWAQEMPAAFREDVDEATRARLLADIPPPPPLPEAEVSEMIIIQEDQTHEATDPVGLRTLLESANPEPLADASQLPPPTPTPGINRARSLPLDLPAAPVRPPSDIDETIGTVAEGLRALSPSDDGFGWRSELKTYRVTYLSLVPLDTLALIVGNMCTSLVMLPFEIYYTRLLARSFLSAAPRGGGGSGSAILRDIWAPSPWLGFREMGGGGSLKFVSRVFLTFGVQSVLSTILWRGFASLVHWQGRSFRWGEF